MIKYFYSHISAIFVTLFLFHTIFCLGQQSRDLDLHPYMHSVLWNDNEIAPSFTHKERTEKRINSIVTRGTEDVSIPEKIIRSMAQQEPLVIEPLLGNIEFGQGAPYNELCPKVYHGNCNKGEGLSAGTTVSPLAQLLTYHKYPAQMKGGTIDYYTSTYLIHRIWDCDNTHFNWDLIQNSYGVPEYLGDKTVFTDRTIKCGKYEFSDDENGGWIEYSFMNEEDFQGYYTFQLWLANDKNQLILPASDDGNFILNYKDGVSAECMLLIDNKLKDGEYKLLLCVKISSKWYICQTSDAFDRKDFFMLTKTGDTYTINGSKHKCIPSYSNAQGMEIANLEGAVGAALRMDYRDMPDNTLWEASVYKALVDNFDYDPGIAAVHVANLDNFYLHLVLQEELQSRRPVYGVYGMNQGFVLDGFRKQDGKIYYHVNWGQYGFGNGYYLLEQLIDPTKKYGNFVWGIQPSSDKPTGAFVFDRCDLVIDKDNYKTNQKIYINFQVTNSTEKTFDGDLIAYAMGIDGKKYWLGSSRVDRTLRPGYVSNYGRHPIEGVIPEDMPAGQYVIVLYSKQDNVERLITSSKTAPFTVEKGARVLTLDKHHLTFLERGEQQQLTATCSIPNAKLVWSSSNETKCSVDQNGVVKSISGGQCSITVSTEDGMYQDVCRVDYDVLLSEIMLMPYDFNNQQSNHVELSCKVGEIVNIYNIGYPTYAFDNIINKSCSDNSVLDINRRVSVEIYCIKVIAAD